MTALEHLAPGASWRARHVVVRNLLWFRAKWSVIISGLVEPLLYLLALGVGVGELVGTVDYAGRDIDYNAFVAPALLATAAFNGAVFESTFNIFAKLKWQKSYDAMVSTPLTPADVAVGELAFSQLRGLFYAVCFLGAMTALGLVESWWALLTLPAAVLIGSAFGAVGLAGTTWMRSWLDFDYVVLFQLPLFLFSATFYPLSTYPEPIQWVVQATPLYHGVELCRQLVLGEVGPSAAVHTAYLLVMGGIGLAVATRRFDRLLRV